MPRRSRKQSPIAVLDLGSNSIKLLVATAVRDGRTRVLLERTVITRLGEGIRHGFRLQRPAIRRTLSALRQLRREAARAGAAEWRAVATSAVRDASNRKSFERLFRREMGFPIRVLSGRAEAAAIFRGATSDLPAGPRPRRRVVMDVGGGSAEWIAGDARGVRHARSLKLGAVRMTHQFLRGDPCSAESLKNLLRHYRKALAPLRRDFRTAGSIIGCGGAATVVPAILARGARPKVHGRILSRPALERLQKRLQSMTQAERCRLRGLPPKRADIIVAGLALFVEAMKVLGAKRVRVSVRNLRYGVLLETPPPNPGTPAR